MIENKTVFIVGAGASTNFGLPEGSKLKSLIRENSEYTHKRGSSDVGGNFERVFYAARHAIKNTPRGFGENDILAAARELQNIMPLSHSIDNYLDAHRDNLAINFVGKLSICRCILAAEGRSNILDPSQQSFPEKFDFTSSSNTWINAFFRKISEGIHKENVDRIFKNVSIITFNYDRCIEHFLFNAIQRYYQISPDVAEKVIKTLTIVHVYGSVGRLPWQKSGLTPIDYGDREERGNLVEAAAGISTFTESRSDPVQSEMIEDAFVGAKRLVFLGFSFQEQNVDILPAIAGDISIVGTATGMSQTNIDVISGKIGNHFSRVGRSKIVQISIDRNLTAENFIDNYWRVID